ncbi:hypothetical protein J7L68_02670 [bacterium]|nr:hypothetical protein [bacterium]
MTFDELHRDLNYNCITDDCKEDTSTIFTRKLAGQEVKEYDFQSHWERGMPRRPIKDNKECEWRSISINRNHEDITDYYKEKFSTANEIKRIRAGERLPKKYCTFKLIKDAGVVKKGQNRPPYHCSLFKSDGFSLEKINLINIEVFT